MRRDPLVPPTTRSDVGRNHMADEAHRQTVWQIDPKHTLVEFAVTYLAFTTVKGHFERVSGTIRFDDGDPARASLEVEIDDASLNTREGRRDTHLRSADFLDVERHRGDTVRLGPPCPRPGRSAAGTGPLRGKPPAVPGVKRPARQCPRVGGAGRSCCDSGSGRAGDPPGRSRGRLVHRRAPGRVRTRR
ncbi:MAG: YceI family protein [Chloroflexota bacterium]